MIQTVLGWIDNNEVTAALPHEHALSDLRPIVAPLDNGVFYDKVSLSNYGELSRNPYAVLDNALLDDKEAVIEEFERIIRCGFNLVADVTTADFGRRREYVLFLSELSLKTGVHIVSGCGSYIDAAVSDDFKSKSVDEMRNIIINDLTVGMEGTDIKAGVIGEIGSSKKISDAEYKFIEAAAQAQNETGFGMHIHACLFNREGLNALEYAVRCGANAEKININHVDVLLDEDYIMGILDRGAYAEFDDFGKEFYVDKKNRNLLEGSFARDTERVQLIKKLVDKGYGKQILISNDVCLKSMLHRYGGWGYDHIGENIVSMMDDFGIAKKDIDTIIKDNPVRFLERS